MYSPCGQIDARTAWLLSFHKHDPSDLKDRMCQCLKVMKIWLIRRACAQCSRVHADDGSVGVRS